MRSFWRAVLELAWPGLLAWACWVPLTVPGWAMFGIPPLMALFAALYAIASVAAIFSLLRVWESEEPGHVRWTAVLLLVSAPTPLLFV